MGKVYVNDSGTSLNLDTLITPTGATTLQILIEKPDGTIVTKTATASGTIFSTPILPADINMAGTYKAQAYLVSPTYPTGKRGETFTFTIYNNYE